MIYQAGQIVGRVAGLYRYPVKSMGGEDLREANVKWNGIDGDRRYAFVRTDDGQHLTQIDFPWFTGREYPPLVTYRAAYADGADVTVTTPDGEQHAIGSATLHDEIREKSGKSPALLRLGRGAYDGMPLLLLSQTSVDEVAQAADIPDHQPHRFRPNILLDLAPDTHEDTWTGMAFNIGADVKIWVARPDPRCMMVNIDPKTGVQQPTVLRHIAKNRNNTLGVYANILAPGQIAIGDEIRVTSL